MNILKIICILINNVLKYHEIIKSKLFQHSIDLNNYNNKTIIILWCMDCQCTRFLYLSFGNVINKNGEYFIIMFIWYD